MEIRGIAALFFALLPINREFVIASMTSSVEYSADYSGISTDDRSIAIRKPANQLAIRFSRYRSPHSIVSFFFIRTKNATFTFPPPPTIFNPRRGSLQLRAVTMVGGEFGFFGKRFFRGKRRERIEIMNEQSKENRKRVR